MDDQERLNRIRVRGYLLACADKVTTELEAYESAVDRLVRLRDEAEKRREHAYWLMEQVELTARVLASGDVEWVDEVAQHLEECFG